jgi:hypothetical protein
MARRSLTRGSTRVLSALSFPSAYAELARTALKWGKILVLQTMLNVSDGIVKAHMLYWYTCMYPIEA